MIPVTLEPCTGRQVLSTKALLDSGCTGSTINHAYVLEHQINTKKVAVPIPVYNADGTRNQGRDITEFIELCLTIREHREHIDLVVTNLGKKDIYLRHDWLNHHNSSVNWKTGSIIFSRCQCVKNHLKLPDADPDDQWDKELEDGDTILII